MDFIVKSNYKERIMIMKSKILTILTVGAFSIVCAGCNSQTTDTSSTDTKETIITETTQDNTDTTTTSTEVTSNISVTSSFKTTIISTTVTTASTNDIQATAQPSSESKTEPNATKQQEQAQVKQSNEQYADNWHDDSNSETPLIIIDEQIEDANETETHSSESTPPSDEDVIVFPFIPAN